MKNQQFYKLSFLSIFLISFFLFIQCNERTNSRTEKISNSAVTTIADIISPDNASKFKCGEEIEFKLSFSEPIVDSILLVSADTSILYKKEFRKIFLSTKNNKLGKNYVKFVVYRSDNQQETHTTNYTLTSDIIPKKYSYKVVESYPHDRNAYTQGLIYNKGILYESTGLKGKSSVRKVDIKTGNPSIKYDLSSNFFGEGIALFNNFIYQITYRAQTGFIYDIEQLTPVRNFSYPIVEGWGLTSDSTQLYMSDGSHNIYIIDPQYFTQKNQLAVYDYEGMVTQLNELEYINGKIFANVYTKSRIVIIDSKTGKVVGELDLRKIIPKGFEYDSNRVLNGIAYNPENQHLYVTGKNWPLLYEIEIIDYFNDIN